ncbi:single-stranded-DNA-specific exonuclease RecJ [Halomicrobium salinisoli]|uniref:single-stranded-DNA-specific exonuclease RecJ n=1 Tax=Halomicrobium salinisoli TaxID=2878391 RepID=UPI001CF012E4|nr:DHH family phosphoesterase [Halomicrobium salinisoli]
MGPVPDLDDRARACARRLLDADAVLLASHIDADGLTSAAVAATALERAGLPFETVFKKQLDAEEIASIAAREYDAVLFTDFGSGQLDAISEHVAAGDFEAVIADHHQPAAPEDCHPDAVYETDGYADFEYHCNPLLVGIDGASELSGAGASYVLGRALAEEGGGEAATDGGATAAGDAAGTDGDPRNRDLAGLAVVGAVGDMQATSGELVGANQGIVAEGVEAGVLAEGTDLTLYGKQTRPLPKLLEYATEVPIPGISNDEAGAVRFLESLGLDLKRDGEWRTWADLNDDERQAVASGLVQRAVKRGVPADDIDSLVGTTYTLTAEPVGTELRDASEFSTLLNATARYERADVGLAVCLGDRDGALERARSLLANHRRNLSEGLSLVQERGVTREDNVQWFDAGDAVRETIVGIVAGMALGTDGVDSDRPIIAFASKDDEETKVSARGTGPLVGRGLDLSVVMSEAARAVGGDGGGHDIAAGATVPAGEEATFVEAADDVVARQLD